MNDRVEDQLHMASQGLQKAAVLIDDDEFAEWLFEVNDELNDRWEEAR